MLTHPTTEQIQAILAAAQARIKADPECECDECTTLRNVIDLAQLDLKQADEITELHRRVAFLQRQINAISEGRGLDRLEKVEAALILADREVQFVKKSGGSFLERNAQKILGFDSAMSLLKTPVATPTAQLSPDATPATGNGEVAK